MKGSACSVVLFGLPVSSHTLVSFTIWISCQHLHINILLLIGLVVNIYTAVCQAPRMYVPISEMRGLRFGDMSNRSNDTGRGVQFIPRALPPKPGLTFIHQAATRKISDRIWSSHIQGQS